MLQGDAVNKSNKDGSEENIQGVKSENPDNESFATGSLCAENSTSEKIFLKEVTQLNMGDKNSSPMNSFEKINNKVFFEQVYRGSNYYDLIAVIFVSILIISNIVATKLIELDFGVIKLIFDGGAVCFPFAYILGDVLSEVYGFKASKRVITMGFVVSILASFIFYMVQIAPPAVGYENQNAYEAVLGFVPRIVLASLVGYFIGQLLNAFVLVKMKVYFGEDKLWVRLVFSTLIGEIADTVIFCTIAFYGVITGAEFLNYCVTGYFYKCLLEIVMLPITYKVIAWIKKHEVAYYSNNNK